MLFSFSTHKNVAQKHFYSKVFLFRQSLKINTSKELFVLMRQSDISSFMSHFLVFHVLVLLCWDSNAL